jgi:hypothetical protein
LLLEKDCVLELTSCEFTLDDINFILYLLHLEYLKSLRFVAKTENYIHYLILII